MSPDLVSGLPAAIATGVTALAALCVLLMRSLFGAILALAATLAVGVAALAALDAADAAASLALVGLAGLVILLAAGALAPEPAAAKRATLRAVLVGMAVLSLGAVLALAALDVGVAGAGATPAARMRLEYNAASAAAAWLAGAQPAWGLALVIACAAAGALVFGLVGLGPRAAPPPSRETPVAAPSDPLLRIASKRWTAAALVLAALAFAAPGGALGAGFGAGGLAAAAFLLYGLVFGVDAARRVVAPSALLVMMGAALLVALIAIGGAGLAGGDGLDMRSWRRWAPVGAAILAPLTVVAGAVTFAALALAFLLIVGRPAALPDPGGERFSP